MLHNKASTILIEPCDFLQFWVPKREVSNRIFVKYISTLDGSTDHLEYLHCSGKGSVKKSISRFGSKNLDLIESASKNMRVVVHSGGVEVGPVM